MGEGRRCDVCVIATLTETPLFEAAVLLVEFLLESPNVCMWAFSL